MWTKLRGALCVAAARSSFAGTLEVHVFLSPASSQTPFLSFVSATVG